MKRTKKPDKNVCVCDRNPSNGIALRLLLTGLRNKNTKPPEFRRLIGQITHLVLGQAISGEVSHRLLPIQTLMGEDVVGLDVDNAIGFVVVL
jgi:uracil phosphoribosyltransferase